MSSRPASSFAPTAPAVLSTWEKEEWVEILAALTEMEAFLGRYATDRAARTAAMHDWAMWKQERPLGTHRSLPDKLSRMRKDLVGMETWAVWLAGERRKKALASAAGGKGKGKEGGTGKGKGKEGVKGGKIAK